MDTQRVVHKVITSMPHVFKLNNDMFGVSVELDSFSFVVKKRLNVASGCTVFRYLTITETCLLLKYNCFI